MLVVKVSESTKWLVRGWGVRNLEIENEWNEFRGRKNIVYGTSSTTLGKIGEPFKIGKEI